MYVPRRLCLLLLATVLLSLPVRAREGPAETSGLCDVAAGEGGAIRGACITALPEDGVVRLGDRTIRPGDVLTAQQLQRLTLSLPGPGRTARIRYLPIGPGSIRPETSAGFPLRGTQDKPPVVRDLEVETYRNLPREALLKVRDPEDQPLTFLLVHPPKRGRVILRPDGSFLYFPEKNKVGTDSFGFVAADPAGNRSPEATVTVRILTPTADRPYADTAGSACSFYAEWLRSTGIFTGEMVGDVPCFSPDTPVSRGQFLAMLMRTLKLPADRSGDAALAQDTPLWLRPYLTAALRSGILCPRSPQDPLDTCNPLNAREAAALIRRALRLAVPASVLEQARARDLPPDPPPRSDRVLNRAQAARMLYEISRLTDTKVLISAVFRR